MLRPSLVLLALAAAWVLFAPTLRAQEEPPVQAGQEEQFGQDGPPAQAGAAEAAPGDWPNEPLPSPWRGTGYYFSVFKILSCWLLFAAWVYTTDWVSQDCQRQGFSYARWNSITFGSFLAAFVLTWVIPWYPVSLILLLAAYATPLTLYIRQRNKQVVYAEKVLTKSHLRRWYVAQAAKFGVKIAGEKGIDEQGPPLQFKPMGAVDERQDNINLLSVRRLPAFIPARQAVYDALLRGADSLLLEFGAQTVSVRDQIDGVWHNQQPMDRVEVGDPVLVVLKTLAGLKPDERRAKQSGKFGVEIMKPGDVKETKYLCKIATQGTQAGERVVLQFEGKKLAFKSLEEVGMRDKMAKQLEEFLKQKQGFILVSALPAGGLSTSFELVQEACDRYVRNFAGVNSAQSLEREVLNVPMTKFDPAAGETPATMLPKVILAYPDVIVVPEVNDLDTLKILVDQVTVQERLVISSTRAKEAVEALLRILALKIPPNEFAAVITAVLNVRLVRKLCETCKEAYPPPPEVLKQMGLPQGRIENFYRPPTKPIDPKHPEKVCETCQGIAYRGRTGIFELLVVDDGLRSVLASQPKLDALRAAARKAKHRSLQEEGLLLVARGVTSLQELLRVLKQ